MVRRPGPAAAEEPSRADRRPVAPLQRRRHRDRQPGGVLDVDLEVVLQVLAHAGQVGHRVDAEPAQQPGVAHPGQLQQLRRVDRASAQDDLPGPDLLRRARPAGPVPAAPAAPVLHAHRAAALERDPGDERPAFHREVAAPHDRVQVGPGGRQPPAPADVPVERGEAFLPVAVHVLGQAVARLLRGLEEGQEQRAGRRAPLQHQRAIGAAELVAARQAVLHLLEVRQAVPVVPAAHARGGGPPLVVQRVPALEDHAVDAA